MNSENQERNNKYIYESKYHQIAVELAEKIAEGWYVVGEKLSARSMVANTFHVSTETARKAVQILVDMGILTSKHGSGTYVASREKAQLFFNRHQKLISIEETREKLQKKVTEQKKQFDTILNLLNELVTQTQRDHNTAYIIPYDMKIDRECNYLGASIGEIDIWQETGATIVAIKRGDTMFISPGPYEIICDGDVLLFVGKEDSRRKMMTLFNIQP